MRKFVRSSIYWASSGVVNVKRTISMQQQTVAVYTVRSGNASWCPASCATRCSIAALEKHFRGAFTSAEEPAHVLDKTEWSALWFVAMRCLLCRTPLICSRSLLYATNCLFAFCANRRLRNKNYGLGWSAAQLCSLLTRPFVFMSSPPLSHVVKQLKKLVLWGE